MQWDCDEPLRPPERRASVTNLIENEQLPRGSHLEAPQSC